MNRQHIVLGWWLSVGACTLQAQQSMPDMPGMPTEPQRKSAPPRPAPATKQAGPAKPSGACSSNAKSNEAGPSGTRAVDMEGMSRDSDGPKAKAAAASEQHSVEQQAREPQGKPGPNSDADSLKVPVQELQEPEALEFRTGGDLPAPELLGEIASRPPMTVEEFLALADGSNPTLIQAQRDVDRSNQQARQVGLPPDPTVGYCGDHIRGGSYHGGEEGAFVSQEFVLGRKLALRRDVLRAEGRSNQYALEVQRARVHNDVAQAFFNALAAQQRVVVRERLLKVALDADTNTHELARVGQADAATILTAEVAAEQDKVEFLTAQRMFLAAFAQLATQAGQRSLAVHPLSGALAEPPDLNADKLAARDLGESPLVARAKANVAMAEAQLKDAKRERIPNLNVTAGEWYSGETLGATNGRAGWESFAQAGVQLPLWNHNQGNMEAAKAILDRSKQEVRRSELWTENQAAPLAQQYETARFTASRYRTEMLPRARRAYELQVTKYQQMALPYTEVLSAQRFLFTLQLGYIEALHQEWQTAIALRNYALTDGLDSPMTTGDDSTLMNLPTAAGAGGGTQ